jgi:YegS/Rv2252/BmrU family lipid kinase
VHIIINPAAGQPDQILHKLNDVFYPAGIKWNVSITQKSGDATRFARQAIADGVDLVAAYGGDGTVMEVAEAVQGGDIPMAILPGGTANLMSVELGIPKDLTQAAQILVDPDSVVERIDMGQAGDKQFMLGVGIGFAAEKVILADRELKDKWGILAYTIAALQASKTTLQSNYKITVDGVEHEMHGLTCLIGNAGNLGIPGVTASSNISVSDGLLDVIVVRDDTLSSLVAVADKILELEGHSEAIKHWQGQEITITADPPQPTQGDGEIWEQTPITVRVIPGVLPVLALPVERRRRFDQVLASDESNLIGSIQETIASYKEKNPTAFYLALLAAGAVFVGSVLTVKKRYFS